MGGRNPECAIARETALPIGPSVDEDGGAGGHPVVAEWVRAASPMCGPSGYRLKVRV